MQERGAAPRPFDGAKDRLHPRSEPPFPGAGGYARGSVRRNPSATYRHLCHLRSAAAAPALGCLNFLNLFRPRPPWTGPSCARGARQSDRRTCEAAAAPCRDRQLPRRMGAVRLVNIINFGIINFGIVNFAPHRTRTGDGPRGPASPVAPVPPRQRAATRVNRVTSIDTAGTGRRPASAVLFALLRRRVAPASLRSGGWALHRISTSPTIAAATGSGISHARHEYWS